MRSAINVAAMGMVGLAAVLVPGVAMASPIDNPDPCCLFVFDPNDDEDFFKFSSGVEIRTIAANYYFHADTDSAGNMSPFDGNHFANLPTSP
jgi:hypothetical protein